MTGILYLEQFFPMGKWYHLPSAQKSKKMNNF